MGSNPFLGIIFLAIGGFCSATNFIPFRGIKRWSWEIYWVIQAFAAWVVAPLLLAGLLVPHLSDVMHEAYAKNPHALQHALLFGLLLGIGAIAFGLAIRYLGIALGYAITVGLSAFFGALIPAVVNGELGGLLHQTSGKIISLGIFVCLVGALISGAGGHSKEQEVTLDDLAEAGERDYDFRKGVAFAILAGIMSCFFTFGIAAGKPLSDLAQVQLIASGKSSLWQNLPVLIIVLLGAFITNFVWCIVLIFKNEAFKQFAGEPGINPMRAAATSGITLVDFDPLDPSTYDRVAPASLILNYFLAALAGVFWYLQFFFYSLGQDNMGKYDFASWTVRMAATLVFATLWGLAFKEWRGTTSRTRVLVTCGLLLLLGSTVIVGYGNYLHAALGN